MLGSLNAYIVSMMLQANHNWNITVQHALASLVGLSEPNVQTQL